MAKKKTPQKRTFKFEFSLPGLLSLIMFFIIAMAWAFILGILVGRGYQPEAIVPELAKVMPENKKNNSTVLKPEELGFYDRLKNAPVSQPQILEPQPKITPKLSSSKKEKPKAVAEKPPKPQPARAKDKPQQQPAFSFTYQIAALEQKQAAQKVLNKLQNSGISSSIQKGQVRGQTWYRIFVHIKGNSQDVDKVKNTLNSLGFKSMLLKEKKALR